MLLEFQGVTKHYGGPAGQPPVPVLSDLSFQLAEGATMAIVGPSGSGKSTLLNLIGALDTPSTGSVRLDGRDLAQRNDAALAEIRNRTLGFIFQSHHLLPQLTLLENVLVPTLANRGPVDAAAFEARARKLLQRVGLEARLGHRPGQLSGGECQRVAVVRALINHPKLLLADEPTGALDQRNAEALAKLLLELNREEKVAVVLVTHWRELADRMGTVYELHEGRLRPARR
ncbi:MAG: ABC transporter ATP-binding protein [Verrucomicrobiota bacterium]|jgi:ABC-type branched-subunit amino acid transport system ATPase component